MFTQIGAVRSVDWIFIVGAPDWRSRDIGHYVLQCSFFKPEIIAAPSYCHIFFLVAILEEEEDCIIYTA
jgi:hypothetical protein